MRAALAGLVLAGCSERSAQTRPGQAPDWPALACPCDVAVVRTGDAGALARAETAEWSVFDRGQTSETESVTAGADEPPPLDTLCSDESAGRELRVSMLLRDAGGTVVGAGGSRWHPGGECPCVLVGPVDSFAPALDATGAPVELPEALAGVTTTVLPDGRVLLAGGAADSDAGAVSSRAYLYDPDCGRPSEIEGGMRESRAWHTATLLKPDARDHVQRVLLAGGITNDGGEARVTETAEVFDPAAESFTETAPMTLPRVGHAAELMVSGGVLVAGGASFLGRLSPPDLVLADATDTAEVFTPEGTAGSFRAAENALSRPRSFATAHRGDDQDIAVIDGLGPDGPGADVDVFDPGQDRFVPADPLARGRWGHGSGRLSGTGEIVLLGGVTAEGIIADAEVYGVGVGAVAAPPLPEPRALAALVRLGEDSFLLAGGLGAAPDYEPLATGAVWSPDGSRPVDGCPGTCAGGPGPGARMVDPRLWHAAATTPAGTVVIAGGEEARAIEIYVPGDEPPIVGCAPVENCATPGDQDCDGATDCPGDTDCAPEKLLDACRGGDAKACEALDACDTPALSVVLTWSDESDLDLWLAACDAPTPGGEPVVWWQSSAPDWCEPRTDDGASCTINTDCVEPPFLWCMDGLCTDATDDPFLSVDDIDGFGPEAIRTARPCAGVYAIGVANRGGGGGGASTVATVRAYFFGEELPESPLTAVVGSGELWYAGRVVVGGQFDATLEAEPLVEGENPLPEAPLPPAFAAACGP